MLFDNIYVIVCLNQLEDFLSLIKNDKSEVTFKKKIDMDI